MTDHDPAQKAELEIILVQAKALRDALRFIYESDHANIWRFGGYENFMRQYNGLAAKLGRVSAAAKTIDVFDLTKVKGQFDTIAMQQKSYCDSVLMMLSVLISIDEQELGTQASELTNLLNFLQSRVRPAVMHSPTRESDIQDVVEQLFIGRGYTKGSDYDREVGRVKVSAKEVIPDFILPKLGLALEVKLLRDTSRRSTLVDEINADIQSYAKRYAFLVFLVYDLGAIRDEVEFKQDLDNQKNVFVVIVKH